MPDQRKLEAVIEKELKDLSDEQLEEIASFARYLRLKSLKNGKEQAEALQKSIKEYTSDISREELQHLEEEFAGYQTAFPKK